MAKYFFCAFFLTLFVGTAFALSGPVYDSATRGFLGEVKEHERETVCGRKTLEILARWTLLPKTNLGRSWKVAETEVLFSDDNGAHFSAFSDELAERLKGLQKPQVKVELRVEDLLSRDPSQKGDARASVCRVEGKIVPGGG